MKKSSRKIRILSAIMVFSLIFTLFSTMNLANAAQASGIVDGGIYRIRNRSTGLYMTVASSNPTDGTNVHTSSLNTASTAQQFKLIYDSISDSYAIISMANQAYRLDTATPNDADRVNIDVWRETGNYQNTRQFKISRETDGSYKIMPKTSNTRVVDIGVSVDPGNVIIYTDTNGHEQRWIFEYVRSGSAYYYPVLGWPYDSCGLNCNCPDHKGSHSGSDIPAPEGTTVYSAQSGTVTAVGYDSSIKGNYVTITGANGYSTEYFHMKNSSVIVSLNQTVVYGQKIGEVGSTGLSTGPHLHLVLRINGVLVEPRNYIY